MGYTYCVFQRLRDALRRRDMFITPSIRYADPRLGLLSGDEWEATRPQVCRMLDRSVDVSQELAKLAADLDALYRSTAATLNDNAAVAIEQVNSKAELKVSPLEKLEASASLRALRAKTAQLMPASELPEVLLEIHTGVKNGGGQLPVPFSRHATQHMQVMDQGIKDMRRYLALRLLIDRRPRSQIMRQHTSRDACANDLPQHMHDLREIMHVLGRLRSSRLDRATQVPIRHL